MPNVVETPQSFCNFGLARVDVTPPVGMYHRMWGAAAHDRSTGVHRPLSASALWIAPRDDSAAGVVLIALDHCVFWGEANARLLDGVAARANLERGRVLVAFSHTHGAGLLDPGRADRPGGDQIGPYLDELADKFVALIAEARSQAAPATFTYGTGRCNLAAHRDYFDEAGGRFVCGYNPDGFADDTVLVIRITGDDGRVLASVVNYACHPTTLAWDNTHVSPDFPGAMRELVERETGAPCVFLQGASGDLGPREGFVGDPTVADRNGRQLGYAVLSALEGLDPPRTRFAYAGAVESGTAIGTWKRIELDDAREQEAAVWRRQRWAVPLPYRPDLPSADATRKERAHWDDELLRALDQGDTQRAAECRAFVERMDRQLNRVAHLPPGSEYPFIVQLWKMGDAFWVAVGGEHYQYMQVELREQFPKTPIVVMSLIDDWRPGYLPTASTYGLGIYQEQIAVLAAGSLETLTKTLANTIQEWI